MSCTSGKIGYASDVLAEQALFMALAYRKRGETVPQRYYFCRECGRYHLTSKELRCHEESNDPGNSSPVH